MRARKKTRRLDFRKDKISLFLEILMVREYLGSSVKQDDINYRVGEVGGQT